jgi:hypothetical protein
MSQADLLRACPLSASSRPCFFSDIPRKWQNSYDLAGQLKKRKKVKPLKTASYLSCSGV